MNKKDLLLYAVTDRRGSVDELLKKAEQALLGGATILQLREKGLCEQDLVAEARLFKALCAKFGVPLIINDELDVALEVGADGVHLGAEDISVAEARARAGRSFVIGATAKTVEKAKEACEQGADYLGVGALFASPTKTSAIRITKQDLKNIAAAANIPVVAIGGINSDNAMQLIGCGVSGIAVSSALFCANDAFGAARLLKAQAREICGEKT